MISAVLHILVLASAVAGALLVLAVASLVLLATGGGDVLRATGQYWYALAWFAVRGAGLEPSVASRLAGLPPASLVHVHSLALVLHLWHRPHYRAGSFHADLLANLKNVSLPGTGLPLSIFCRNRLTFALALILAYPLVAMAATVIDGHRGGFEPLAGARFRRHLLQPRDWFSLWRLNCRLASMHAAVTHSRDFDMESKWAFTVRARACAIPVVECLDVPRLVAKHKDVEGGQAIYFFNNALHGGDWILQRACLNAPFIAGLLPANAPLSTIRIVTASAGALGPLAAGASPRDVITPLSAVFRAGRAGAATDHKAVLFDIDMKTGRLGRGTVNSQWYQLGWAGVGHIPRPASYSRHPDGGAQIEGLTVPDMGALVGLVQRAHFQCCPSVPLCGWDVALTTDGVELLEVNLSCNFFLGTVNFAAYDDFVLKCFVHLERLRRQQPK